MPPLLALLVLLVPADDTQVTNAALVAAHNRERAEHKLPPLVAEPRLTEAARLHAVDMATHAMMSHDGSDGSTPAQRVKAQGYPYITTGENVAKGQTSVDEVMTAWMKSPHHRDNILGDFTQIGVARVEAEDGTPYWSVDFGRPFPRLDPTKAEAELADRLNDARKASEKPALRVDPRLSRAARGLAADLAARGPVKPDDKAPADEAQKAAQAAFTKRLKESGYAYATVAESMASGNPTPEALVKSLLDSTDQKPTILGDFHDLGVGYALADDGRPFWCLLLAKPRD